MSYRCPYCSKSAVSAAGLQKHLRGTRPYGGHELSVEESRRIVSNLARGAPALDDARPPALPVLPCPATIEVLPGGVLHMRHWRALELLENTRDVREALALYERATGHPVYLRPTAQGLTVISLDPSTPAMVGVGGAGDCSIQTLPAPARVIETAVAAYRMKVAAMTRNSAEERYVVARIRASLANALELDANLLFLHQEWRFSTYDKLDILALDRRTGQLVVIEAKGTEAAARSGRDGKGRTAADQATLYVAQLTRHAAEYLPFFERLAGALCRIYRSEGEAPRIDPSRPPRWELWWPGGRLLPSSEAA